MAGLRSSGWIRSPHVLADSADEMKGVCGATIKDHVEDGTLKSPPASQAADLKEHPEVTIFSALTSFGRLGRSGISRVAGH